MLYLSYLLLISRTVTYGPLRCLNQCVCCVHEVELVFDLSASSLFLLVSFVESFGIFGSRNDVRGKDRLTVLLPETIECLNMIILNEHIAMKKSLKAIIFLTFNVDTQYKF